MGTREKKMLKLELPGKIQFIILSGKETLVTSDFFVIP